MRPASIDELIHDWKHKLENSEGDEHTHMVEKFREILEYALDPRFAIVPYRKENGDYDYMLKMRRYKDETKD